MSAFDERRIDPSPFLERLADHHRGAVRATRCERLELYHRAAVTRRVRLDAGSDRPSTRDGVDEGLAVRLQPRGSRRLHFAATSGGGGGRLAWAVDRALRGAGAALADAGPWPAGPLASEDPEPDPRLPAPGELEEWLREARKALVAGGGEPARGECWIEVARTVESWVADPGLRASRTRVRAWALARPRMPRLPSRPLILARRGWVGLRPEGWRELLDERRAGAESAGTSGSRLLFTAESAAELVAALARVLHGPGCATGPRVGPGWSLFDGPREADALFGGLFDDSGFPTAKRVLADGRRVAGITGGPGQDRRPSFRDPPRPLPWHLVVTAPQIEVPGSATRITGVAVHPLGPEEWLLETVGPLGRGYIRTAPLELARRCVGAAGPSRLSHRGVHTPPLLFSEED